MNWTNPQGVLRTYWGESECQAIASEAAAPGVHAATDSVRTASRNACTPSEGHRTRWKSDDSKPMRGKRLNRCNDPPRRRLIWCSPVRIAGRIRQPLVVPTGFRRGENCELRLALKPAQLLLMVGHGGSIDQRDSGTRRPQDDHEVGAVQPSLTGSQVVGRRANRQRCCMTLTAAAELAH